MKRHRNIRRIDDDTRRTHAWLVQVQRRGNIIIKMFSDNIFGGKQKALSAALEYRDALIFAAPSAEHNLWRRTIVRRNNTSGIPGVGFYTRPNGSEKWVAYWIDENGIRKSRTFSVNIYGKRKAKQLAIAERQRQLERIYEIKTTQIGWPNPAFERDSPRSAASPSILRWAPKPTANLYSFCVARCQVLSAAHS